MAGFRKMVSMERTDDEKSEALLSRPIDAMPDVPYGLCISLTEVELEKLGLEADCEVGDTIHLFAMAKVTSITKNDSGDGAKCRLELAITDLGLEDEDNEEGPDDADDARPARKSRYRTE